MNTRPRVVRIGALAAILCLTRVALLALTAPTLSKPANTSTGCVPHPGFYWGSVSGADSYRIEIATDSSFADIVADRAGLTIPRYVPLGALGAGTYYWRVTASEGAATATSGTFTHTVTAPANTIAIGASDSLATIRSKLATAAATAGTTVDFPGTAFTFDVASDTADFLFTLSGATDLVINGHGSSILVKNKSHMGFMKISDSTRVTVRDLVVDYDPVAHSLVKVLSNASTGNTLDLDVELMPVTGQTSAYYPELTANPAFTDHWSWACILDKDRPGRLKTGVRSAFGIAPADVTRTNGAATPARYRVYHPGSTSGGSFAAGDIVAILGRTNVGSFASTTRVTDMTFAGITSYASPMGNYYSFDGSELKVLDCHSVLRDSSRYLSANADGVHCRANPIGPWIEGCEFIGNGDDGAALYNKGMFITAKTSTTSLTVANTYMNLQAGDVFRVFDPAAGAFLGANYTVADLTPGSDVTTVAFSPALAAADYDAIAFPTANDEKFQLFNASRRNDRFMISGNTFTVRARGTIVRSATGLIENNTYAGCSAPAVALYNEAAQWYNGAYCRDVTIIGNTIADSGFDTLGQDAGAITVRFNKVDATVSPHADALSGAKYHDKIVIAGNTIRNAAQHGILLANASNSIVTANTIESDAAAFVHAGDHHGVSVRQTYNTLVAGNNLSGEGRPLDAVVYSENNTALAATGNTPPLIQDNADAVGVAITGTWATGTGVAGYYGSNYLFASGSAKSVRFTPPLVVAGDYEILIRWTAATNRATNAPVEIDRDGGTTSLTVNQQVAGSQWVSLGIHALTPGQGHGVVLRTDGANGYVVADAARFILRE